MGGLDDQWREIVHQNWSHAKSNFCTSLPVDPDSVEQCEKVGLLRDGEDSTSSGGNFPQDESDTDTKERH